MSFLSNIFRTLSQKERRVLWIGAALILIGSTGLAIFFVKNSTVAVPAYSGTYSEGAVGQPSYVNPVLAASDEDQSIVRLVFASLRDLAESVDASADGKTIEIHLKQGLVWSDGQTLDSDDVVFTLESIQNPDSRSPLAGLFERVKVERVSALQVNFQTENVALSSAILDMRPAPKHLYGDIPIANWRLSNYNLTPIASGPYSFASHDIGIDGFVSAYRLTTNKSYAGERPYLQKINFLFFRNEDNVLSAFNSGQIQGFQISDPALLQKINRPYDLARFSTPTVYSVFWNQTTNPALSAIEARWALSLAVDRDKILAALQGYGQATTQPLPPAMQDGEVTQESTQVPEASASSSEATASSSTSVASSTASNDPTRILETRGWKKGDDGIWAKSIARSTVRLEFTLTVPDIGFLKKTAEELVSQWQAFGAKVNLKLLPPDASLMAAITNRSYDGLLFGNTVRGLGDLYPFWHSSERFAPGLNLSVYRNARADTLLESLRQNGDPEKRKNDLAAVSKIIMDDEPAVFLFSMDNLFVSSKNLEGVTQGFLANPADRLELLPKWYVNTSRRLK